MIGDWLWYKGQFNAFPFMVEQITKKKVGYHAEPCECRMHYLRLSECQPIPLTADILNKNGMHLSNRKTNSYLERCNNCGFFEEDKYFHAELSLDFNGKIRWSTNCDEYTIIPLDYVHELQHALKLCGINKEIIL